MAFMKINDLIGTLTLVVLTLPSIVANIDCNGKPFHCVNSTHFMICVDLGSGVSSTIDDFVIPCPPTTICLGTNRFECEFPPVTTTTPPTVQPIQVTSEFSETFVKYNTTLAYDVTTSIPFEEYYNTISTTTLSENKRLEAVTESTVLTDELENLNVMQPQFEWNSTMNETVTDLDMQNSTTARNYSISAESTVTDITEIINVRKPESELSSTKTDTTPLVSGEIVPNYRITKESETEYVSDFTLIDTTPLASGDVVQVYPTTKEFQTESAAVQIYPTTEMIQNLRQSDFTQTTTSSFVSDGIVSNYHTNEVILPVTVSDHTIIDTTAFVSDDIDQISPTTEVFQTESESAAVHIYPTTDTIQNLRQSDFTQTTTSSSVSDGIVPNYHINEVILPVTVSDHTIIDTTAFVSDDVDQISPTTEEIQPEPASDPTLIPTTAFVFNEVVQMRPTTEVIQTESAADTTAFESDKIISNYQTTEEIQPEPSSDPTLIATTAFVSDEVVQMLPTTKVIQTESAVDTKLIDNTLLLHDDVQIYPTTDIIQTVSRSDPTLIDTAPFESLYIDQSYPESEVVQPKSASSFIVPGDVVQIYSTTEVIQPVPVSGSTLVDTTTLESRDDIHNYPTKEVVKPESNSEYTVIDAASLTSDDVVVQNYSKIEVTPPVYAAASTQIYQGYTYESTLNHTIPILSGNDVQNVTNPGNISTPSSTNFVAEDRITVLDKQNLTKGEHESNFIPNIITQSDDVIEIELTTLAEPRSTMMTSYFDDEIRQVAEIENYATKPDTFVAQIASIIPIGTANFETIAPDNTHSIVTEITKEYTTNMMKLPDPEPNTKEPFLEIFSNVTEDLVQTEIQRLSSTTLSSNVLKNVSDTVVPVIENNIFTENLFSTEKISKSVTDEVIPLIIGNDDVTSEITTKNSVHSTTDSTIEDIVSILQERDTLPVEGSNNRSVNLSQIAKAVDVGFADQKTDTKLSKKHSTTSNSVIVETTPFSTIETILPIQDIEATSQKTEYDLNLDIESIGQNKDHLTNKAEGKIVFSEKVLSTGSSDSTATTSSYKMKDNKYYTGSISTNVPAVYAPIPLASSQPITDSESSSKHSQELIADDITTPGFFENNKLLSILNLENPLLSQSPVETTIDKKQKDSSARENTMDDTNQFSTSNFPTDLPFSYVNTQMGSSNPFTSTGNPHGIVENNIELNKSERRNDQTTSGFTFDITPTSTGFSTESLVSVPLSKELVKGSNTSPTGKSITEPVYTTLIHSLPNQPDNGIFDKLIPTKWGSSTIKPIQDQHLQTTAKASITTEQEIISENTVMQDKRFNKNYTTEKTPPSTIGKAQISIDWSHTNSSVLNSSDHIISTESEIPLIVTSSPQGLASKHDSQFQTVILESTQAPREVTTETYKNVVFGVLATILNSTIPPPLQQRSTTNSEPKDTNKFSSTTEKIIPKQLSGVNNLDNINNKQIVTETNKIIIIGTVPTEFPTKRIKENHQNIIATKGNNLSETAVHETTTYDFASSDYSKTSQEIIISSSDAPKDPSISPTDSQIAAIDILPIVTKPTLEVTGPSSIIDPLTIDVTSTRPIVDTRNTTHASEIVLANTTNKGGVVLIPTHTNQTSSVTNQKDIDFIDTKGQTTALDQNLESDNTHSGISVIPKLPKVSKDQMEQSVGKKGKNSQKEETYEKPEGNENPKSGKTLDGSETPAGNEKPEGNEYPEVNEKPEGIESPEVHMYIGTPRSINDIKIVKPFTHQINRLESTIEPTTQKLDEMVHQSNSNIKQLPPVRLSTESTTSFYASQDVIPSNVDRNQNSATQSVIPSNNSNSSIKNGNIETTVNISTTGNSILQSTINITIKPLEKKSTSVPAFPSTETNFVCSNSSRGRHSDNKDCRKFFICIGKSQPIEGICPNNTVFSEIRKQCTKNLSHCIRNNQFQCISEGRFSDYLKDNVYYVCVKNNVGTFIRFKLQCQSGYHLNKTSVRCALNTESFSVSDNSKNSEQSVSSSKNEKFESNKKFECKKIGKFPDAKDCKKYYVCTKTAKTYETKVKNCDSDEIFHKDKKKCVDADSYECS